MNHHRTEKMSVMIFLYSKAECLTLDFTIQKRHSQNERHKTALSFVALRMMEGVLQRA